MPEQIFISIGPFPMYDVIAYLNGNSWHDRFFGGYKLVGWQVVPDLTIAFRNRRTDMLYYGILQLEHVNFNASQQRNTTGKLRTVHLEKQ
jgi:hypothetical protein